MPATTAHKELAAHLRQRLSVAGIKAGCAMQEYCGEHVISIYPRGGCDARFTLAEQDTIRLIADVNHLTLAQGLPIVSGDDTHGHGFKFYMGYAR